MGVFEFLTVGAVMYFIYAAIVAIFGRKTGAKQSSAVEGISRQLSSLEQRMRVIEEIVSSDGYDLRREIDGLRDTPDQPS